MTGRTHDLAAITALGVLVVVAPLPPLTLATALLAILANQLGGIAPDIDEPTAPLWRNLPIGGMVGRGFDRLLGGHRFLTHSLLGVGLFGAAVYWLLKFLRPILHGVDTRLVWYAFMIGLLSHLVMDTFTKEGVPWLLPVPLKFGFPPVRSLRVTTGQLVESVIIFPALVAFNIYWISQHYEFLLSLIRRITH